MLVIGVPDHYRGEAAKAFVKLRAGAALLTLDALRAFLKSRIGPHEMPAELEIRAALPGLIDQANAVVGKVPGLVKDLIGSGTIFPPIRPVRKG